MKCYTLLKTKYEYNMENYNFDELTIVQIKDLIKRDLCTNEDVVNYYNNEWWDQEDEF